MSGRRGQYRSSVPLVEFSVPFHLRNENDQRVARRAVLNPTVRSHLVMQFVLPHITAERRRHGDTWNVEAYLNPYNEIVIVVGCQRHAIEWWREHGVDLLMKQSAYAGLRLFGALRNRIKENREAMREALENDWSEMLLRIERTVRAIDDAISIHLDGAE